MAFSHSDHMHNNNNSLNVGTHKLKGAVPNVAAHLPHETKTTKSNWKRQIQAMAHFCGKMIKSSRKEPMLLSRYSQAQEGWSLEIIIREVRVEIYHIARVNINSMLLWSSWMINNTIRHDYSKIVYHLDLLRQKHQWMKGKVFLLSPNQVVQTNNQFLKGLAMTT